MSYDVENQEKERNSRSTLGWVFATILLFLLIILTVQFFYSPFEQGVKFWEEHSSDLVMINPKFQLLTERYEVNAANPWNINFLIDPSNLCATHSPPNSEQYTNDTEVKLLMLVPSAVDHFVQRTAIRNTWGSVAEKPFGPMRLAFVLGTTANRTIDDLVREESLKYGDIIQADFVDGYHQLTAKSILMLKWVAKRCAHAQYFLKADDDTFVNLSNIAHILSCEPYLSEDKFISGCIQTEARPQRMPEEVFDISTDDYSGEKYPPYAYGSAYVMTIPTAIELFQASQEVKPLLPEEDVYLTGLCAQHIAAPLIHEPTFVVKDPPSPPSWKTFSPLATVHSVTPDTLELVWDDMTGSVPDSVRMMEAAINSTVLLRKKKSL